MTTTYAARPYGQGWIAGVARLRRRGEAHDIDIRQAKRAPSATEALRAAIDAHPPERTETVRKEPAEGRARTRQPDPDRLRPQALQILHHLILRSGLTARQAMQITPPCYRLAARVREIRDEFGDDAVETIRIRGASHCRYVWRGPDSIQTEMEGAA